MASSPASVGFHSLLVAQAPAGAVATEGKTIIDYIQDGGVLSYVLIGLSMVAVALIVRNLIILRGSRVAPPWVFDQLEKFARSGDVAGALEYCRKRENECMLTAVVGDGLQRASNSPLGLFELRQGMEETGRHELDNLHRSNDGIGIIAAVGPMIGLLGTVIGMIGAFGAISALQGAARSSELARFMSMALVNTAEGLIVAIPCTIAFALFRRRIDTLGGQVAQDAEDIARLYLATVAAPGSEAPGAARGAVRPGVSGAAGGTGAPAGAGPMAQAARA
ncbi:MAG: MotA/TolQ/ExbB proton channel family protein [Planctomycetota bacterium]|nr:MotA/TolQ/ExbB proton channel family protein [Planctomycetota bacterium]